MAEKKSNKLEEKYPELLMRYKPSKRKLARKAEFSEDEDMKSNTMCKERRVVKYDQTENEYNNVKNVHKLSNLSSAIQTKTKYKTTKNGSKKGQVSDAIQMIEENADVQLNDIPLTDFGEMKSSNVIWPKSQKHKQISAVCDESVKSKSSVSGSGVPIDHFNKQTHDESRGLESSKQEPEQSFKRDDSSLYVNQISEGVSHQNVNDVQHMLLPKQRKLNLKSKKNSKNIKRLVDIECYVESENSDSCEWLSTENGETKKSESKNKKSSNKKNSAKKGGKKDIKMKETIEESLMNPRENLIKLVQCALTYTGKRNKLRASNFLQAYQYLFNKPFISESTFLLQSPKIENLTTVLQPEKYEVQKSSSSNPQFINSDYGPQTSQELQDYFMVVTKSIFYVERHSFKYAMNDLRQNCCVFFLYPFFYRLTVEGIKMFFPERIYLERIFDVINAVIENPYSNDQKQQYIKEVIQLLFDYLLKPSPASVQWGKKIWSSADLATNFLVGLLRKSETFSKEMYNTILLYLETLFQDTSNQFYFYYNALAILIAFGPLAVFHVLSKNFLPFYNRLSKCVNFESNVENSSQHEALLVYGHLRSAVELLIKQCSDSNYFKHTGFFELGSSSLSDTNQNNLKETEQIFDFILNTNILQYFGDSLSSRLPLLTNCFVNAEPFSRFAEQLEKELILRNAKQHSGNKSKIINSTEIFSQIKSKNSASDNVSKNFKKLNVKDKRFNYLKNGVGNLYRFL